MDLMTITAAASSAIDETTMTVITNGFDTLKATAVDIVQTGAPYVFGVAAIVIGVKLAYGWFRKIGGAAH